MVVQVGLEFGPTAEKLSVEKLVTKLVKEALHMAILPRRAGLDEGGFDAVWKLKRPELGAVIRNQTLGRAMNQEQPLQLPLNRGTGKVGSRLEEQKLTGEAVQHRQNPGLATALQTLKGKV
jgi:hypothetical protein